MFLNLTWTLNYISFLRLVIKRLLVEQLQFSPAFISLSSSAALMHVLSP